MNVYRLRLIAALTAGLMIGLFGWHWANATESNEAAHALEDSEAVVNTVAERSQKELPTEVASAKPEPPYPELQGWTEKGMVWAQTESTRLSEIDRLMVRLIKYTNIMSSQMADLRRHGMTNALYSKRSESRIRRSLVQLQLAHLNLHVGLIQSGALLGYKPATASLGRRLSASMEAYRVLMADYDRALMNFDGIVRDPVSYAAGSSSPRRDINPFAQGNVQAISDAAGSSGPRTYINRYVQDKPQAISDAAGK